LLQFAIWGSYLTSLGQFLGSAGLGADISWFYAAVGLVSLVMPALAGYFSDRYVSPHALLSFCHCSAAVLIGDLWGYAQTVTHLTFWPVFIRYVAFLSFYLPTIALANTTSFRLLSQRGEDTLRSFPRVRIWGTVGFVLAMWFVNSFYYHDGSWGFTLTDDNIMSRYRLQYNSGQLLVSSILGFITAGYSLSLRIRQTPVRSADDSRKGLMDILGWSRFNLFRNPELRSFLIFAILAGVCLQISNAYVTPYITHFAGLSQYAGNDVASNATMLFSISQISEALCILGVGMALRNRGIKSVLVMAMLAWGLRYASLALGNPGSGLWLLIISMIAYGVAFNYFNIAGAMYVDRMTESTNKGFGQGVLMLMSNGVGATLGMFGAGAVVNYFCHWQQVEVHDAPTRYFMGDWTSVWWIFAVYSLIVALLIFLILPGVGKKRDVHPQD
ncbi:MAG: MFS transporter, partial [Muribaculaceae bacterium]|nr:MFS transporter [Muribaculaceae bacterium]